MFMQSLEIPVPAKEEVDIDTIAKELLVIQKLWIFHMDYINAVISAMENGVDQENVKMFIKLVALNNLQMRANLLFTNQVLFSESVTAIE